MSWLFAANKTANASETTPSSCYPTPLFKSSTCTVDVAVGGNPDTTLWHNDPINSRGWAVAGTGICMVDSHACILKRDDWHRLLSAPTFNPASLDGHFVVLRWDHNRLECFTDQLGLRTLYYTQSPSGVHLSTRLDWLARAVGRGDIDFASLGSRWLTFNQLSYDSCIVGIERLGPGGQASFCNGTIVGNTSTPWTTDFSGGSVEAVVAILSALLKSSGDCGRTVALGLSGGIDSRLLLAILTQSSGPPFHTYSFGGAHDPDVVIARRIAADIGISHRRFDDPLPAAGECILALREFASQSMLTEPVTSYLKLRYYSRLRQEQSLMIDGGFGELARRRYLNRVVKFGHRALRKHNAARILEFMKSDRPNIFSPEVARLMSDGARADLERTLDEMPDLGTIGIDNFADLLAVRTRIPNYGAPEQSRMDGEVLNFMPFVQPTFLRTVFGIPPHCRSNALLHRTVICKLNPQLASYPLVKGGHTRRFGRSNNLSWLSASVQSALGRGYVDPAPDVFFAHLGEWILDLVHSSAVVNDPVFDSRNLRDAVSRYYRGDRRFSRVLDWWLTFELWRRALGGA